MFINFAKFLVLLSTVSAHTESSDEAVVHMKPKVVTASSNSNLLRGASASVWKTLVATDANEDRAKKEVMASVTCRHSDCKDYTADQGGGDSYPVGPIVYSSGDSVLEYYCCTECMLGFDAHGSSLCNKLS